jgi:DNA polymerase I-like protein with 3'-5' exonuclease and polymerase domains
LFDHLFESVTVARKMREPYDRERRLMPILLRSERAGVPIDLARLEKDLPSHLAYIDELDAQIRRRLKAPTLDVDSKDDLALALRKAKMMRSWKQTKTGEASVGKASLEAGLKDPELLTLLVYRGAFATITRTFLRSWHEVASRTGGRMMVTWNQVRQSHGYDNPTNAGARTGRLSSNPNLMNVPIETSPNYEKIQELMKATPRVKLRPFPLARAYIAAPRGKVLINRDYSQQELRILGHYEGGALAEAYRRDPWLDVHTWATKLINGMLGTTFTRRPIKDVGFGLIYGMGLAKLAMKTKTDEDTAKTLRDAYLKVAPGIKGMQQEFKRRAAAKLPIRTWGGREYHVEPPRVVEGRIRSFEYKLLNVLVQGSAADCTKQAMINLAESKGWQRFGDEFILQVHDELLSQAEKKHAREAMIAMREAMEAVEFGVSMLTEGEWGRSWEALDEYKDKR